jgi:hypothetical protein
MISMCQDVQGSSVLDSRNAVNAIISQRQNH